MNYPKFFDEVEHIVLQDELGDFLGTSENGIIDIAYLDIVKVSGHSCATVGGAYMMALKGLKALYGKEYPQRGKIKVELKGTLDDGSNTGVVAMVFSNITGATDNTGFLGVQGRFNRRGLLFYGANIDADVRFTRLDTGKSVDVSYSPGKVKNPKEVLMTAIGPNATEESKRTFPKRWQEMVNTLFDNIDKIVDVKEV